MDNMARLIYKGRDDRRGKPRALSDELRKTGLKLPNNERDYARMRRQYEVPREAPWRHGFRRRALLAPHHVSLLLTVLFSLARGSQTHHALVKPPVEMVRRCLCSVLFRILLGLESLVQE